MWFSRLARIDPNDNISVKTARINKRQLKILPHIENNPFVEHLFRVFASEANKMSLDDFINMISVFSDAAPVAIKSRYAFRVYGKPVLLTRKPLLLIIYIKDFESKGYLTKKNVNKLIQILIGANEMSDSDINKLVEKVYNFFSIRMIHIYVNLHQDIPRGRY